MILFSVYYTLIVASNGNGEYSDEVSIRLETMTSTSNYLPDIMADIYEKHRGMWIMGIEIKDVKAMEEYELAPVDEGSIRLLNQILI